MLNQPADTAVVLFGAKEPMHEQNRRLSVGVVRERLGRFVKVVDEWHRRDGHGLHMQLYLQALAAASPCYSAQRRSRPGANSDDHFCPDGPPRSDRAYYDPVPFQEDFWVSLVQK